MAWEVLYYGIESGGVSYKHESGVTVSVKPLTLDGLPPELREIGSKYPEDTVEKVAYFEVLYEGKEPQRFMHSDYALKEIKKILKDIQGLPNLDLIRAILIGARFLKKHSPQEGQKLEDMTREAILKESIRLMRT